ncbi:MAG: V-type ATP synthase subunit E [Firmicutes bacterium]|nr:V-type ATP synthase subunit E [Bacillota bacterium]
MSIEKITAAILDEAATESEQILNVAKTKGRKIINDIKYRTKVETDLAIREAAEEKDKIIERRKSVAELDSKKIVLAAKQECINECFEKAQDYILNMEEAQYVEFLVNLGKASGLDGGVLIFNEKERESIGSKVVEALSAAVPGSKFELSDETRKINGGFVLQKGQMFISNTIDAIVEEHRQELVADVAAILFPPEK